MSGMGESDAKTHRTPKALRAKFYPDAPAPFREALGVRTRPRVAFRGAQLSATRQCAGIRKWSRVL